MNEMVRMPVAEVLVFASALGLLLTAAVHSILGEKRLIRPLLVQRGGVLKSDLARFLLRAVWHFMSVTFALIAVVLFASASKWAETDIVLLAATAVGIGGAGLYDAIGSRGRHIGWPMLVGIGLLSALALLVRA